MAELEEHGKGGVYSSKGKEYSRDMRYIPTRLKAEVAEGEDAVPVEAARAGKAAGATVVALTSLDYSAQAAKGRVRLADLADVVIDNGLPPGDAMAALPGTDLRAGPGSTALGAALLQAVFAEVAARLAGSDQPELAQAFLDFLLSEEAQAAIPTTNWMYPAVTPAAGLPEGFESLRPAATLYLSPEEAEAGRERAVEAWRTALAR